MNPAIDNIPRSPSEAPKKGWLERAFPVPRSLIISNVSLYVSDGVLRFFEFSRSRGKLHPKKFGAVPFPRYRVTSLDEKMKAESADALRKWATENHYSAVRAVVHEDEAYVFKVTVPTAAKSEIRAAIEDSLEENVPIPPAESVFEYEIIESNPDLQETTVAVSVLSQKSVLELLALLESAGLFVVSINTEARALARALFQKRDRSVHALVSVEEHHSIVSIVESGAVVFSSSLRAGSADIDKAIAKAYGINESEARKLKLEKAFSNIDSDPKLFDAMTPVFSVIRDELSKVLVYWKSQGRRDRIPRDVSDVILSGSDSLIAGFDRYLAIAARIPVRTGSVWTNVLSINEVVPDLPRKESLDYGVVIGNLL